MRRCLAPVALAAVLLCLVFRAGSGGSRRAAPPPASAPLAADPVGETDLAAPTVRPRASEVEEPPGVDPEYRALRLLLREQKADGSWGHEPVSFEGHLLGPVGLTAFALLGLTSEGYQHLSKDVYDGFCVGDAVKSALRYLQSRQGPDGRFSDVLDPPLEQALGARALAELYGVTGSRPMEEPAQRALDALWRAQGADGSWGTRSRTDWAAMALYTARLSGLADDPDVVERLRGHYARREAAGPDVGAALFRLSVLRAKDASLEATAAWIAAEPVPADPDQFGRLHYRAELLLAIDGPVTARWRAWQDAYQAARRSTESAPGLWSGGNPSHTVLRNGLSMLDAVLYHAYRNIFRER